MFTLWLGNALDNLKFLVGTAVRCQMQLKAKPHSAVQTSNDRKIKMSTEEERQILSPVYIGVGFFYNEAMNVEYYRTWIYTTSLT